VTNAHHSHPLLILQTAPWPATLCLSNMATQRRFDLRFEAIISPRHRKARSGSHGVNRLLKVHIEYDGIERGITDDLISQGIAEKDIILSFLVEPTPEKVA
jgi:hypothetical protein